MKLTSNLIYEAALDDGLFAELPAILAHATDARSCVLHWRDEQGAAEIFAHSGYFSDEDMADYAENFVTHDLWTEAGMKQGFVNRAWRTSDLVAASDYERSVFYNDWIRAMGDDTFHCSGSVMRTVHGDGIIGLHRGRTQPDFTPAALKLLNQHVDHLKRMFAIRARISGMSERNDYLTTIISSSALASFVIDQSGRLLLASPAGECLLREARFLRSRGGQIAAAAHDDETPLRTAIALATAAADARGSTFLLRGRKGEIRVATTTPMSRNFAASATVLLSIDSPRPPTPPAIVQRQLLALYELSGGEADIALRLADGHSISEISEQRNSAIGTVRTQVKQILSKMNARRQSDIVGTVERLRAGQSPATPGG